MSENQTLIASSYQGEISSALFTDRLIGAGRPTLSRADLSELQINLGYRCNQACEHCHVEAGPKRTEEMTWDTMQQTLAWIQTTKIRRVDLTGGAPEMNPHFQRFCEALVALDVDISVRCNLTILMEPGYEHLVRWYAENKVRVVASLPCYSESNVDAQRGKGVFGKSIDALQRLNAVGYGVDKHLPLTLVYNPVGPNLPPAQAELEQEYKIRLQQDFDIQFSDLVTITNLPIKRYKHYLAREGLLEEYMGLLDASFNADTLDGLMCRYLISVDWRGRVYDCDFNQMLEIPLANQALRYLWDIDAGSLTAQSIAVAEHCFGCTAGQGSSCSGALVSEV